MKLELGEKEVGTIIEILKFSLDSCPVESIGPEGTLLATKSRDLSQNSRGRAVPPGNVGARDVTRRLNKNAPA